MKIQNKETNKHHQHHQKKKKKNLYPQNKGWRNASEIHK
jgi:hypothetical protein